MFPNLPRLTRGQFGKYWGIKDNLEQKISSFLISETFFYHFNTQFQVTDQVVLLSNKITGFFEHLYLWKERINVFHFFLNRDSNQTKER